MALSAFTDKAGPPSNSAMAKALGPALLLWREVRRLTGSQATGLTEAWGYTSQSTGWGLRLKQGKRVILYLTPREGEFLASLALGEKAIARAREAGMPKALEALIAKAPKYAEGRGVRLTVSRPSDVALVERLVAIKLST